MFFVYVFGLLGLSIFLYLRRDKTPLRPLTPEERLYSDLRFMQDRQNAIEEDRRMTDRMRHY